LATGWAQSGLKEYSAVAPDGVVLAIQEAGNPDRPPVLFIPRSAGRPPEQEAQFADGTLAKYRLISSCADTESGQACNRERLP
jgi:hypothetical protein